MRMWKFCKCSVIVFCLTLSVSVAQENEKLDLGKLISGAKVTFVRNRANEWGIEISNGSTLYFCQSKPAQIQVFTGEINIQQLASGYQTVTKVNNEVIAKAKVNRGNQVSFDFEDRWKLLSEVLVISRKVTVSGTVGNAGFYSAVKLSTPSGVKWFDADFFAPGLLYGDPTYDGDNTPGGTLNYQAKRLSIREDLMSAPLFGISFHSGKWVAILNLAPDGQTTTEESNAAASTPVIDEQIRFGALGSMEMPQGGIEFGYWMPGTTNEFGGGFGGETPSPLVRHRYNPVKSGFTQNYTVGFRFGNGNSLIDLERDAWRWAWESLHPKVNLTDVELIRKTLIDHLSDHVVVVDGWAGVPFLYDAVTGKPGSFRTTRPVSTAPPANRPPTAIHPSANVTSGRAELSPEEAKELAAWAAQLGIEVDIKATELWRFPRVVMGFVSKGIESADQLLIESDRDSGPRGQKMRQQALQIIQTFIQNVPMAPPAGEGFNLWTRKPDCGERGTISLRAPSEDMRALLDAYRREKKQGREYPEWVKWCRQFADWLLSQQKPDGSFPRSWDSGTKAVKETSGTASYNPVPMLVRLSEITGQKKYLESAVRAGNYVWDAFGCRGVFVGGATDNPNITDKEAGMLSMEAFLCLYETTKDKKWLDRAKFAGDFDESWIWIWNVPMPIDADNSKIHWKPGVPTVGVQGITARAVGGVDQYLAWASPAYLKLYKYTGDKHYLDVVRVLLHDTKAMLALPGRTYDLLGPGWQQEHWQMGPRRGFGGHRSWLPWVSVNHLHGITGLQEIDPDLFKELCTKN